MTKYKYFIALIFSVFFIGLTGAGDSLALDNVITVDYDKEIGLVNKLVTGTGVLVYDRALFGRGHKHSYGNMDFGAGIWDPAANNSVKEVVLLAKEAGISSLRFTTNNYYKWKDGVGDKRKHFLFGVDEFLETASEISAEPIFTIPYFKADIQDAADLVEYLNGSDNDLHPWATERVINGHIQPYKVKYFEIGNETWDIVSPGEYGKKYLDYYKAMKAVDPSISIGVVLHLLNRNNWNNMVMDIIGDKVDFGILHTYPTLFPRLSDERIKELDPLKIFNVSLAVPVIKDDIQFEQVLKLLKEKSGRDIPLAITEHNGGFIINKPIPYRHSLGTALINAELLRIFMKPENKILMANYHKFSNGYFGMIKSASNYMKHDYRKPIKYSKRPNYYVYEMYNKHFGDMLINVDVNSESYNIDGDEPYILKLISRMTTGVVSGKNLLINKWKIKNVRGIDVDDKDGTVEINFIEPAQLNYFNAAKHANVKPDKYYRLSGYMKTEDLADSKFVSLMIKGRSLLNRKGPAVETVRLRGTTDWQYVDVIYKTPSYADSVNIKVYAKGKKGELRGKVYVKDVKLEQFTPELNIPYLSANASKSEDGSKIYLMVINKNMDQALTSLVNLKNYLKVQEARNNKGGDLLKISTWTLNGPSVEATNEINANTVKVKQRSFKVRSSSFEMIFEPHSLTAVEIQYI